VTRYRIRIVLVLALVLSVGLVGLSLIRILGPGRLEAELERRLSAALSTPVVVDELSVSPGSLFRVDARGVRAWPGADGAGLEIQSVSGSIDALSLLIGKVGLRRVRIDGASLRISAVGDAGPN
jgi:uncharacterized protein YhdP